MEGESIGGYKLRTLMMTGQTSQVWEVVEPASSRHLAMKMLLPEHAHNPDSMKAMIHEATVGMQLRHPNVINILKLVKDHDPMYFLMEFFPAGSLKLRIMRKQMEFIHEKIGDIFKQWATALAYMNAKGWVHRDVKADNVLVNNAGELRIIDFALAQRIQRGFLAKMFHKKGKSAGTRSYMSPEQIRGEMLDARADIYSFGASAFEVVTGRPPFRGASNQDLLSKQISEKPPSPVVYNPEVTDEFAALVVRMLAKKREDRPRDFHEVLTALRSLRVFKSQVKGKASPST